jgi:hypothetical protein
MVGDERIGYFTAEKQASGNYIMDGVYVEPEYRNQGIATEMLRKAHATVNVIPYALTDNQVYQSEAGKGFAAKELRMVTASTIVTAGPLLAIPELLGAGEAAAGAGEAAAGAEGGGLSDALKNLPSSNSSGNKNGDNSNDINNTPDSGGGESFASPANPVVGSTMPLETHPLAPTKPITVPPFTVPGKPSKTPPSTPQPSPTTWQPAPKTIGDKTEAMPETSLEEETSIKNEQETSKPTKQKPEKGSSGIGSGINLELNFPQAISNFPTPAHPITGSNNRLIDLLNEDRFNTINNDKPTSWE